MFDNLATYTRKWNILVTFILYTQLFAKHVHYSFQTLQFAITGTDRLFTDADLKQSCHLFTFEDQFWINNTSSSILIYLQRTEV